MIAEQSRERKLGPIHIFDKLLFPSVCITSKTSSTHALVFVEYEGSLLALIYV